jgi:hypothetical protein
MNTEKELSTKKENLLRKWGLESVVRQFILSVSTTLTQILRDAYKSMSGVTGTVVKVNLLDRDWQAFRNDVTGILEGRRMRAAIVAKMPSGKYLLYNNFLIHQDYLGTGYSDNSQVLLFEDMEILPENIK